MTAYSYRVPKVVIGNKTYTFFDINLPNDTGVIIFKFNAKYWGPVQPDSLKITFLQDIFSFIFKPSNFKVIDRVPPIFCIHYSLKNNSITKADFLEISGAAEPDSKIFINGTEIKKSDFYFYYKIQLNYGRNYFKIIVKDIANNTSCEKFIVMKKFRRVKPSLNLKVSDTKVSVGDTITVSGKLEPFKGEASISLKIISPVKTRIINLNTSAGYFSYNFTVDVKGIWKIEATIRPNIYYLQSTERVTIIVKEKSTQEKKCIIATVTFGSELSPEVQFLRNFRDKLILSTRSGSAFYIAFDAFYYSWSTSVANFIEKHDFLKNLIKIVIYPLIGILKIVAYIAIPLFLFNGEMATISAGSIASILIGLVYLTPLLLLIKIVCRKIGIIFTISQKTIRYLELATLLSISMITVGLMLNITLLLVLSTSSYIISLLLLIPIKILKKLE